MSTFVKMVIDKALDDVIKDNRNKRNTANIRGRGYVRGRGRGQQNSNFRGAPGGRGRGGQYFRGQVNNYRGRGASYRGRGTINNNYQNNNYNFRARGRGTFTGRGRGTRGTSFTFTPRGRGQVTNFRGQPRGRGYSFSPRGGRGYLVVNRPIYNIRGRNSYVNRRPPVVPRWAIRARGRTIMKNRHVGPPIFGVG